MSLPTPLNNPIALLHKESAAMRTAAGELDGQIANALIQKANLLVMAEALEREAERLELFAPSGAQQLEFELVS